MAVLGVEWGDQRGDGYVIACHLRDEAEQAELLSTLKMFAAVSPSVEGEMLAHAWCQAHGLAQRPAGRSNEGWEIATGIDAVWLDLPAPAGANITTLIRATYSSFIPGAVALWLARHGGGATVFFGNRRGKRGGLTVRAWCKEPARERVAARLREVSSPFGEAVVVVEGAGPSGEVDATVAAEQPLEAARAIALALRDEVDLAMISSTGYDTAWKAFDITRLIALEVI
jgi:hypothetical protein